MDGYNKMRGGYVKPPPCGKYKPSTAQANVSIPKVGDPARMWFLLGSWGWKLTKEELDAILK